MTSPKITIEFPGDEFDYIVCGGGTSGCVVATRLAEDPTISVLVIEAGKDNAELENTQMAGAWTKIFDSSDDWNFVSTPQKYCNDRAIKLSRGKYLGGSSGCNGTICVRGTKQDYDDWNMPGWSGEDMWRCMKKAENYHPKTWFKHSEKDHGSAGPLSTEPHDPAPITLRMMESFESFGLPFQDDMFSTGEHPNGCGHVVRTVHEGIRSTSAAFLKHSGNNLSVLTQALVDKVNLQRLDEDNGSGSPTWKAIGVDVVLSSGEKVTVKARREIIVSGGAYCSPAILLRSGIGDKTELAAVDVDCKVHLPGVGKNLMDHVIIFMHYEVTAPGLTTDHFAYAPGALQKSYEQWKSDKSGFLGSVPFGAFAFARLDQRLSDSDIWLEAAANNEEHNQRDPMHLLPSQPNIEFFCIECYGGPKQFTDFPVNGESVMAITPELFSPHSRGSIALRSKDPQDGPIIDVNFLEHPLDLEVMAEGARFANEIVLNGAGTKDIVPGAWPRTAKHQGLKTREEWKEYVKETATTCYHPAGSCKMGKADDPLAVLDERLRVRGVEGLRVADTSVMPLMNQGHTQTPAYGIGEKCAEMIKGTF